MSEAELPPRLVAATDRAAARLQPSEQTVSPADIMLIDLLHNARWQALIGLLVDRGVFAQEDWDAAFAAGVEAVAEALELELEMTESDAPGDAER